MYQRIMEILVLLMDELNGETWKADQITQFSEDLIQRGYTEQEINTAFYWLYNRFNWDSTASPHQALDINEQSESSHRVLHTTEQRLLTPEAYGYLLQLKHLKLIASREIEEVIERLLILDIQPANIEDVKVVVQSMMFEEGGFWIDQLRPLGLSQKGESYH